MGVSTDEQTPRADARRNREMVLHAATQLLASRPEASMREVAEASGVGRTTVYRHFPTREDLLAGLFDRAVEIGREHTTELVAGDPPLGDVLQGLGETSMRVGHQFRFLQSHTELRRRAVIASSQHPERPLSEYFARMVKRGEMRGDLPMTWVVAVTWSVSASMIDQVEEGLLTQDESGPLVRDALMRVFAP